MREEYFKNLLRKSQNVTDKPTTKSNQLDIKLGQFTHEELTEVKTKIKNKKASGLDEIPPKV